ncbi:MAG TPA: response regulator [Nitrospinaceae bacterium]|nr:response regulator [Nitrospinaceae bacterium]
MAITKSTKRFLCIDDDRTLLLIVKQILTKSFGAQTLEFFQASTGEEGLQIMREIKPDIILCDIHMPGMDGFEVCQRVRELKLRSAVILCPPTMRSKTTRLRPVIQGQMLIYPSPSKKVNCCSW